MQTTTAEPDNMAKAQKTTPVRLSDEAIKWARIASGYTGESMAEYASRVVAEKGKADADRLHAKAKAEAPPVITRSKEAPRPPDPPRPPGPRKK